MAYRAFQAAETILLYMYTQTFWVILESLPPQLLTFCPKPGFDALRIFHIIDHLAANLIPPLRRRRRSRRRRRWRKGELLVASAKVFDPQFLIINSILMHSDATESK